MSNAVAFTEFFDYRNSFIKLEKFVYEVVEKLQLENSSLKEDIENLNRKILVNDENKELKIWINNLSSKVDLLATDFQKQKIQNSDLKNQFNQLKQKFSQSSQNKQTQSEKLIASQELNKGDVLKKPIDDLNRKVDSLTIDFQQLKIQHSDFKNQFNQSKQKATQIFQNKLIQSAKSTACQENMALEALIHDLFKEVEKLQLENSSLKKELEKLNTKIIINNENQININKIISENIELRKSISDLNRKVDLLTTDFQKLKIQNSDLKNQFCQLQQKSPQTTQNKQTQPVKPAASQESMASGNGNGNPWSKYKVVENDLQLINRKFVSLDEDETRKSNEHFKRFMENFVEQMKITDKLFKKLYVNILYAGSFYDGLKVGKADEFDLDLIMKIPVNYSKIVIKTQQNYPGYVRLKVDENDYKCLLSSPEWSDIYRPMLDWFDGEKHLLPDKFRRWMQSVVQRTFNTRMNQINYRGCQVKMTTSGPAVTLHLSGVIKFDVDLVPVIQMQEPIWPPPPVRAIPDEAKKNKKTSWYCVPKPLKNDNSTMLYWRLALHEQEKVLINGKDRLKPALRLLKKFRDTNQLTKIASYYLKTICLWEVDKPANADMWRSASIGYVFVHLLKAFRDCLQKQCIPYYWQKQNNLLKGIDKTALDNIYNRIKRIIEDIEKDSKKIPNYILTNSELIEFNRIRDN